MTNSNVDLIDQAFAVAQRFWRTPTDFVEKSHAILAMVDGQAAALCYAAAVAYGQAEIDVMTLPAYRHLGLAKAVVQQFTQHCRTNGTQPLWDCFINNTASMALCQSSGFTPLGNVYPLYTISR